MNKVSVFSLEKNTADLDSIKRLALKLLKILEKDNIYLEIYLVGGARIKKINAEFRGINKNTDILSFNEPKNFPHPENQLKHLGEIYLNPSLIKKRYAEFSNPLARLLRHGLLHLLGYNHAKKSDRIKMEKREKFLMSKF